MTHKSGKLLGTSPTPADLLEQEQQKAETERLSGEVVIRVRYRDGKHIGTKAQAEANYPPPQ